MHDNEEVRQVEDEPPPFLGRWSRVYAVVVGWLAFLIAAFTVFTRRWAP